MLDLGRGFSSSKCLSNGGGGGGCGIQPATMALLADLWVEMDLQGKRRSVPRGVWGATGWLSEVLDVIEERVRV